MLFETGSLVDIATRNEGVQLAVIPEGAPQGFTDEVLDMDHAEYREEIAIDIAGEETDILGEYAQEFGIYLVASAKERTPEYPEKFFNTAFVIDPDGEVILTHRKVTPLLPVERSVSPHDVWDDWRRSPESVVSQTADVEDGTITHYRTTLHVAFTLQR